jgi:pimeloyl-ACP methyl ester carboxylesterase
MPARESDGFLQSMLPGPLRGRVRPVSRLAVRRMVPADPTDVLVTLDAEDAFDVEADLPRVTAPTLAIGGAKDHFYSPELFQGTAAGVPDGRAPLFPGWGHGRASTSTATTHLTLGFMLAGVPGTAAR